MDVKSQEDIRYSIQDESAQEIEKIKTSDVEVARLNGMHGELNRAGEVFSSAVSETSGHRINAVEADKLAAHVLRLSNSQYDRETLTND